MRGLLAERMFCRTVRDESKSLTCFSAPGDFRVMLDFLDCERLGSLGFRAECSKAGFKHAGDFFLFS